MISEILEAWKSTQLATAQSKFICKFCNKAFVKETTLTNHLCEKKRRHQQEKETGVQWGLQAYVMFYNSTQMSAKAKSYEDFCESSYYLASAPDLAPASLLILFCKVVSAVALVLASAVILFCKVVSAVALVPISV